MDHEALLDAARSLTPLLRETAREAEIARRPLDRVIEAACESGLFAMMVPEAHGGHEADLDTFFDASLILSRADAATGWLLTFYIEHNYWFCGFPESFQKELFSERNFALAPATLNAAAGNATRVDGGYQLNGQWEWGTGVIHADWIMVGALMDEGDGPLPFFFALPRGDVEAIDTWHMLGMCGTGSWDIKIDDVFVPNERVVSMIDLISATGEAPRLYSADLYRTPLMPILGFAAGLPILGAAQMALEEYCSQTRAKTDAGPGGSTTQSRSRGKPSIVARAALDIEAAELLLRDVLAEVQRDRDQASLETRSKWATRQAHAVFLCRDAVRNIASVTGASGSRLDNPIQRALRDITTASNHVVFDPEMRYADFGRMLLGQPIKNLLV